MRTLSRACLCVLLGAWFVVVVQSGLILSAPSADARSLLSREQMGKLSSGSVLVDISFDQAGNGAKIQAVLDVPAAVPSLWRVILDCDRAPEFLTGLEDCRVLEKDGKGRWDLREHRVRWAWFLPELRCIVRSEYIVHRSIRFQRAGGDMPDLDGRWVFQPIHNGRATRLYYEARVDPGIQLPRAIAQPLLQSGIVSTLMALRREAVRINAGRQKSY